MKNKFSLSTGNDSNLMKFIFFVEKIGWPENHLIKIDKMRDFHWMIIDHLKPSQNIILTALNPVLSQIQNALRKTFLDKNGTLGL